MQKNPMQGPHRRTHVGWQEEKQRRKGRKSGRKERVDSASEMNEVEGKQSRQMKECPDECCRGRMETKRMHACREENGEDGTINHTSSSEGKQSAGRRKVEEVAG